MGKGNMGGAAAGLMLLLVGVGAFPDARSGKGSAIWTPLGPAGLVNAPANGGFTLLSGRIDVAVSDPRDANVMYVGTNVGGGPVLGGGGVWKTTNYLTTDAGGPTWIPLTDDFPSLCIWGKSLTLYPGNPDILYAAASGPNGGVLKTIDGGAHWEYLLSGAFSGAIFGALVINPTDSNTVYVAVRGSAPGSNHVVGGVYRLFTNTGSTPINLTSEVAPGSVATDVIIDPSNPLVLYAGLVGATDSTNNGLYKSTDGGESWQLLTNGLLSGSQVGEWIALALAPSWPQTVYTTIFQPDNSASNPSLERFVTSNAGNSWSMLNLPATGSDFRFWHVALAVDPNNPSVVYANAKPEHFVVSTDSGQTWTPLFFLQEDPVNVYFDSNRAPAFVGDRGIQRVVAPLNPRPTVVSKQGNLGNFLFYNVTLDPSDPRRGFGVSQDQLYLARFTGAPRWTYVEGTGAEVGKVLIDPQHPDVVYNRSPPPPYGTFVRRSTDGGIHWLPISNGIDISEFSTALPSQAPNNAFALDENQPSRLVLGGQRVWQTLDRGENWTAISPVLSPTGGPAVITAVAIAPSRPDTLYAATQDGLFFATFDGGASWLERNQGLPFGPDSGLTRDIAIDPTRPNRVFIQTTNTSEQGGRIWMTSDGGLSWTSLDSGIPANLLVMSLAVDWRAGNLTVYAGTTRGVFSSIDLGMHWLLFGQGLPRTIVMGFQILPKQGLLVAATFGRGVYQIPLAVPR
ncbi:MAG: hypothetical protein DMF01_04200 [Verrucomicrobia bacterium]|nr:MAG: hypothetical protein DMF01_04200 [Verrucomicrobiota bacterium]